MSDFVIDEEKRKNLGSLIREIREKQGFGLNQLALKLDISSSLVSKLENGLTQKLSPFLLQKVGKALKIDYKILYKIIGYLSNEDIEELEKVDKLKKEIESLKNNSSGDTYSNNVIKNVKGSIHINIKNGNKKDYSENDIIEKINELSVEQQKEVFKFIEFQSFQKK